MKVEVCFTLLSCILPKKERCVPGNPRQLSPSQGTMPALTQHGLHIKGSHQLHLFNSRKRLSHALQSPRLQLKTEHVWKCFPREGGDALIVSLMGFHPVLAASVVLEVLSTSPRAAEGAW